jgi:Pyruvate/2-oxoacid:ferredoxin oxidoreductase gamma subunit
MNEIAQELGEPRCANMVGLGAVVKALALFPVEAVISAMEEELGARGREKLVTVNKEALLRGYSTA